MFEVSPVGSIIIITPLGVLLLLQHRSEVHTAGVWDIEHEWLLILAVAIFDDNPVLALISGLHWHWCSCSWSWMSRSIVTYLSSSTFRHISHVHTIDLKTSKSMSYLVSHLPGLHSSFLVSFVIHSNKSCVFCSNVVFQANFSYQWFDFWRVFFLKVFLKFLDHLSCKQFMYKITTKDTFLIKLHIQTQISFWCFCCDGYISSHTF